MPVIYLPRMRPKSLSKYICLTKSKYLSIDHCKTGFSYTYLRYDRVITPLREKSKRKFLFPAGKIPSLPYFLIIWRS